MRGRVYGSDGHDPRACRFCRTCTCYCKHRIGNGQLFHTRIKDDVLSHSHSQHDDGRLVLGGLGRGLRIVLRVQMNGGVPVIVEERIFVLF